MAVQECCCWIGSLAPSSSNMEVIQAVHSPSGPPPWAVPAAGDTGLRRAAETKHCPTPGASVPARKGSSLEAAGWQQIRSWVMSCKGKSPKGVRGGWVSWGEQMTPAWITDPSKQPGGSGVPCLGQGEELRGSGCGLLLGTDLLGDLG